MVSRLLYITLRAEAAGERKSFFDLTDGRYGEEKIDCARQLQRYVYRFRLTTLYDIESVLQRLQENGVYVLMIEENETNNVWTNQKYDPDNYPAGDLTVAERKIEKRLNMLAKK